MVETALPDGAAPPSALPVLSAKRRRWAMTAAMMAMFMAAVKSTIVSTAMPTIVAGLGGFDRLSLCRLSPGPGGDHTGLGRAR